MSGESMSGASGSEAAWARETSAAPNRPAAEVRKKCLRVVMGPRSLVAAGGRGGHRGLHDAGDRSRRAGGERHLQVRLRLPEVALRLEVGVDARHRLARVREQL